MRTRPYLVVSTLAVLLASCQSPPPAAPEMPFGEVLEDRIVLGTGSFDLTDGDVFECFYTPLILDRDVLVSYGVSMQASGGHHVTVYYTTATHEPEHHPCDETEMASWRQITAAEVAGGAAMYHVDGLATLIPAGAQVVMQAHYINTEGPRTVADRAEVFIPRPEEIRAMGGSYVVDDDQFEIPARARLRRTSVCRVGADTQVALLLGHMHEHGVHFRLERLDATGGAEVLYEQEWEAQFASHPPTNPYGLDTPLLLPAGTRLRQTCEWNNTEVDSLLFPREMCITYMITFPATDGDVVFCPIESSTDEML